MLKSILVVNNCKCTCARALGKCSMFKNVLIIIFFYCRPTFMFFKTAYHCFFRLYLASQAALSSRNKCIQLCAITTGIVIIFKFVKIRFTPLSWLCVACFVSHCTALCETYLSCMCLYKMTHC